MPGVGKVRSVIKITPVAEKLAGTEMKKKISNRTYPGKGMLFVGKMENTR